MLTKIIIGMEWRLFWAVITILTLSIPDSSEGYTCYDCRYVSTHNGTWLNATCTEPFSPNNITTCEGPVCLNVWMNFTSTTGVVLQRTCNNDTQNLNVKNCLQLNTNSSTNRYFIYQKQCCFLLPNQKNQGKTYDQMNCGCQEDQCNGYVSYPPSSLYQTTVSPTTMGTKGNNFATYSQSLPEILALLLMSILCLNLWED